MLLLKQLSRKPTRQLMRFARRTETIVLRDHKSGITEQSSAVKLIQKLSPREELRAPVQRLTLSPVKLAAVKIHEQS